MKPHIWRGDAGKVPRIGKKWKDLCNRARDVGGVFQNMFEIGHSDDFYDGSRSGDAKLP